MAVLRAVLLIGRLPEFTLSLFVHSGSVELSRGGNIGLTEESLQSTSCWLQVMDSIGRLVRRIQKKLRRHGLRITLYAGLLKALRHHRWLKVLRGHYAEDVHPAFLPFPRRYAGSFLTPRALAEFARDPQAGISEEFVQYALGKGDKCYGFTYNGALRAYGWYATAPTRVSPELKLYFSRDYIYMYKGYTHTLHRASACSRSG